jgi:uncharacterized protein DUF4440
MRTITPSANPAQAEIRAAFDALNDALAARDWGAACARLAPEATTLLRADVEALGVVDPPSDCPTLLQAVYEGMEKTPDIKEEVEAINTTAKVEAVNVTGDFAGISYFASVNGRRTPFTQIARNVDGEWKITDVKN